MQKAILGRKVGMTQVFTEDGVVIPVTVIAAGPVSVVQKKTVENDGQHTTKPLKGHFAKAGVALKKVLREFRLDDCASYNVGDEITAEIFAAGDKVDVTGTSKGKGFAGSIKRWGSHRGPMTHGSGYHRRPGSLGACSTPSRVMKNKKLPGHMGVEKVTIQNLDVVRVDAEKNLILVKGAVPGAKGGLLIVKNTVKA